MTGPNQARVQPGTPTGGQFVASARAESAVTLGTPEVEHRRDGRPTHDDHGNPRCNWCAKTAVTWEALLRSSGGQYPRNYRCEDHQRTSVAPGYVSGNITDTDRIRPSVSTTVEPEPDEPTPDQSYCDVGRCQQCSGYTEDESDPETCMHDCHDPYYLDGARW